MVHTAIPKLTSLGRLLRMSLLMSSQRCYIHEDVRATGTPKDENIKCVHMLIIYIKMCLLVDGGGRTVTELKPRLS